MSEFYMAGTEKTGEYFVVAVSSLGRVGCRDLGWGFRVRVEPSSEAAAAELAMVLQAPEWKQPGDDGQNRFSCVIEDADLESRYDKLMAVLLSVVEVLNRGDAIKNNPEPVPAWWIQMVDRVCSQFENWVKRYFDDSFVPRGESVADLPVGNQGDGSERASLVARARELKLPGANCASRWKIETLRAKVAEFEQS